PSHSFLRAWQRQHCRANSWNALVNLTATSPAGSSPNQVGCHVLLIAVLLNKESGTSRTAATRARMTRARVAAGLHMMLRHRKLLAAYETVTILTRVRLAVV